MDLASTRRKLDPSPVVLDAQDLSRVVVHEFFAPPHEEFVHVQGILLGRLAHGCKVVLVQKPLRMLSVARIQLQASHDPSEVWPPVLGAAERDEVRRRTVVARYVEIDPGVQFAGLGPPVVVASWDALGEVPQHVDEVVVAVSNLHLELPQCGRVLAEKVRTVEEETALLVVLVTLHHVVQVQAEGLVTEKPAVVVPYEVPSPFCDVADLAADRVV
mmetsp:Transcript_33431/g.75513  ORF Transcript_33431/g.75513 Transcript_33431/m.75513 type:complete len:216 (-) Transcript_33431:1856-2503(-)